MNTNSRATKLLVTRKQELESKIEGHMAELEKAQIALNEVVNLLKAVQKYANNKERNEASPLRQRRHDTLIARAETVLRERGEPMRVGEILQTLGLPERGSKRSTLSSQLGKEVKARRMFTRAGPGLYSLIELKSKPEGTAKAGTEDKPAAGGQEPAQEGSELRTA